MNIFLVIKVTDVNNNPLKKCSINVDFGGTGPGMGNQTAQPAGPDGTFEVQVPDAADIVSVTVEKPPSFLAAHQQVKVVRGSAGSQNPSLIFTGNGFQELNTLKVGGNSRAGGGFNLEIYFALGQLVNARFDVEAVKTVADKTSKKILTLDQFNQPVIDFVGLTVINPGGGSGWNQLLQTAIPVVVPKGKMLYARRVDTPKLIAIWVPQGVTFSRQRNNVDPATKPLNFHVFYHPSPGVLSGSYPFSFAFVDLICRYLFYYKFLHKAMVNQHQAAGVNTIFVFPVGSPGTWNGGLGGQSSVLRLLQEVGFFVQRMDRIPIPLQPVGKCAVSGFSASGTFVNQAMALENAHFDQNVLREIYGFDLRGVSAGTFASSVTAWRDRNAKKDRDPRKFRIYTTLDSWFDAHQNVDRKAGVFSGAGGSKERSGTDSSVVFMPVTPFWSSLNPAVTGDGKPASTSAYQTFKPVFDDVHQIIPALFMEHALKNSQFK
jgi:hypothetical protein